MPLIILICATMFFFGLYAWAQSGATLLELRKAKKQQAARMTPAARAAMTFLESDDMDDFDVQKSADKKDRAGEKDPLIAIRELETSFDRRLRSCVKVLGTLIVCVWGFAILTFVLDAFNIDWMSKVHFSAARFWDSQGAVYNAQGKDTMVKQNIFLRGLNWNRSRQQ
ncbi:hypothetical protein AGMMS49957_05840 [Synergistales bacterium]|nr:hypothetical protein AGMMS49957_05840 [Synergistales bacterium]